MWTMVVVLSFFIGLLSECAWGLRFTHLGVPGLVMRGRPVELECGFALEGRDSLYSVKWYKDNVEFFRFLPADNPAAQAYKLKGVFPDVSRSNATHAFLHSSDDQTEGVFGCEVSTETPPHFRTIKAEKEMLVYELPEGDPSIFGMRELYPIGSTVNVTCVFGPSKPAARLTWYIYGEKAPDAYVTSIATTEISESGLSTGRAHLSFVVDPSHLRRGNYLSLRCEARVSLVHSRSSTELVVRPEGAEFHHVPHVAPGVEGPSITGAAARYSVGDIVHVNCSSARSEEPAQLQWYVNDKQVQPEFLIHYPPVANPDLLSSSRLGLRFRARPENFAHEEMRLRCEAALAQQVTRGAEKRIQLGIARRASGQRVQDNKAAGLQRMECTSVIVATIFILCFS